MAAVSEAGKTLRPIEDIDGAPRPSIAVMDLESANAESYTTLAQSIESEFGRLDGLVLNASILGERFSIEQYDAVLWQKVMHVNVTSVFAMTQVFLPLLQQSDDPSVIFTSSGVGRTGKAFWGAYAVSKFATEGLSQILADEHRHGNLRSNCINPGATRTNMRLAAFPAEDRDHLSARKRFWHPIFTCWARTAKASPARVSTLSNVFFFVSCVAQPALSGGCRPAADIERPHLRWREGFVLAPRSLRGKWIGP